MVSAPVQQRGTSPVLMLHARVSPGADAVLLLPEEMNGFMFVSDPDGGRIVVGGDGSDDGGGEQRVFGGSLEGQQMAKLPPGGSELRLRNPFGQP